MASAFSDAIMRVQGVGSALPLEPDAKESCAMSATDSITQELLKEYLDYDPDTGLFVWKKRPSNRVRAGEIAGTISGAGYIFIGLRGKKSLAHRFAFLYMNGFIPVEIDHIDHNRTNNAWTNLRSADRSINSRNAQLSARSTSGHTGVYWIEGLKKWRSTIFANRKNNELGYFLNKQDAIAARKVAEREHGFHPNHGRKS